MGITNGARARKQILNRCKVCGEPTRLLIGFPLLDGSGRVTKKTVRCICRCGMAEREAIERKLRFEAEQRKVLELSRMSLLKDNQECKDARFSTYEIDEENKKPFHVAQEYVKNFEEMLKRHQGLLFYGGVGTGKSYTAAAIANELLDRSFSVIMTSFVKIIEEMQKQTFDENAIPYLEQINRAKLLIIDDLGAERGTDYMLEKVYDITDSRYRIGRPIIFTTNLSMKEMKNCTDIRHSRIYDRIFEMCYPVKFEGLSRRKRRAAKRYREAKCLLEG